jgi:hypothetical protein|tara:strand:+ start:195 stop:899 length:705 start_codon:yes stop_codon:yes gene_type:complete
MSLLERFHWFSERDQWLLFLHETRFLNPLVVEQFTKLEASGLLDDPEIRAVVETELAALSPELPVGAYFPAAISRTQTPGTALTVETALQFHYAFIQVDAQQRWSLRGHSIVGRVLQLFQENLGYEPEIQRYFVEYWTEGRWDKCYLACELTPMLALNIALEADPLEVQLINGKSDAVICDTLWLDDHENCLVRTAQHGDVLLADAPRYQLLQHYHEDEHCLKLGIRRFALERS